MGIYDIRANPITQDEGGHMGLTLSHISALDTMRMLRNAGEDIRAMNTTRLYPPSPWKEKRFAIGDFVDYGLRRSKSSFHSQVLCAE